jgi:tetratricopeptide (TPR) repeat protein
MLADYEVFLSHAWRDGERPQQIKEALEAAGLRVWFDATEIDDFAGITRAVTEGLAKSKALLAYYSATYPLRRACQWELTAAFLAAQTEGNPRRRVLVINPESGADHIHPIELRDAKFLKAPNTDTEMQQLVQAIVKRVGQLTDPLPDIRPLDPPPWHGIRPVRYKRFVGRFQEMWKIHSALHETRAVQITGASGQDIAQVTGLGGIGKSLLAREYALRFGPAYPGGVFWLSAYGNDDTKDALTEAEREALRADQVRDMAGRLGITTQGLTVEEVEGALARKLASKGKSSLWVVDDVPSGMDGEALERWFAPHSLARTLLTTRSRGYDSLAKGIDLSVLTPDEAYQLLTSQRKPPNKEEEEQARELAKDLGYHALALDVTGSALISFGGAEPFREFRAELARDDEDALELANELVDVLPNGHEKSIAKTLLRSITLLGSEGRDFLRLASVLAVAPIPASLVISVLERADTVSHDEAVQRQRRAFREVTAASLAEIVGGAGDSRSVHTLVSRTVRFRDVGLVRSQVLRAATIDPLLAQIAGAATDPRLHPKIESHVAHARQVVSTPTTLPEADLLDWVAQYDQSRGSYRSARILYSREVDFRRRMEGHEHPKTLISMGNLGSSLIAEGDIAGARKLQQEVLASQIRILGPRHPQTLATMANLAEALRGLGDLPGASELVEQALSGLRDSLGPENPRTITTLANLGTLRLEMGNLPVAQQLLEEALSMDRRVLGPDHPGTLKAMNNLATTLKARGEFTEARKLQEEALEISRSVLGAEHPDVLRLMNNLAVGLSHEGRLSESLKLSEEALALREKVLGPEHPETLGSATNVASTLRQQGNLSTARNLQEKILRVECKLKGAEHPETLNSMNNLALIFDAQGALLEARQLHEETLAGRRRALGPEHPDTLSSMNNLSETMRAKGNLAEAHKLQREALASRRRVLGPEHPDTLNSVNNLASTLRAEGDIKGARKLVEEALDALSRVLGPEHPSTLTVMHNLSVILDDMRNFTAARTLKEKTLEIRRRVLGPEHPDTAISASSLVWSLLILGQRDAARSLIESDLRWLLERDASTLLGASQRRTREEVARAVEVLSEGGEQQSTRVADARANDEASKRQVIRAEKIGRNDPCPCGSGKKYKKCCGTSLS